MMQLLKQMTDDSMVVNSDEGSSEIFSFEMKKQNQRIDSQFSQGKWSAEELFGPAGSGFRSKDWYDYFFERYCEDTFKLENLQ